MSQLKPMRGFRTCSPTNRQDSIKFRKIFNDKDVAMGHILANRRFFTRKIPCPMCKPKYYIYGDTKRERLQKLEEHLKEKHS